MVLNSEQIQEVRALKPPIPPDCAKIYFLHIYIYGDEGRIRKNFKKFLKIFTSVNILHTLTRLGVCRFNPVSYGETLINQAIYCYPQQIVIIYHPECEIKSGKGDIQKTL